MERTDRYLNGVANPISVQMPVVDSTDVVTCRNQRLGDDWYYDFDDVGVFVDTATSGTSGVMTSTGDTYGGVCTFKIDFTPVEDGNYSIICYNETKDVPYSIIASSSGEIVSDNPVLEFSGTLSLLEAYNEVLDALGQPPIESFPTWDAMDSDEKEIFRVLDMVQIRISKKALWNNLNTPATITLVEGQTEYDKPDNFGRLNKKSFVYEGKAVEYTEFDIRNRDRLITGTGIKTIYQRGSKFIIGFTPTSADVGLEISYTYYAIPSHLDINFPNRSSWFPATYDYEVWVMLAIAEMQQRRLQSESATSYAKVYGDITLGILPSAGSLYQMKIDNADNIHLQISVGN